VPALNADVFRRELARGGLQVYTTVNMDIQRLAESIASTQVAQLKAAHNMNNAAVVVIRPDTGEILAMVGSVDFNDETIDGQVNVTTARRQPGSAMKPFTYAAAFEHGWNAATVIWDVETHIPIPGQPDYVPVNYDRAYHGPVRLREALANSYNIPAVQTLRQVGVEYLIWLLNRVGVTSLSTEPGRYGLSLTLGGGEVSPLELTTAFATLANGGVYVPTQAIACVTTSGGEVLFEYQRRCPPDARLTDRSVSVLAEGQQVLDPRIAFIISHILADNDARTPAMGANSPLYTPGIPTSVKTGTTNDFRDNWTVGYTPGLAVGVWTGNTDNSPMVDISGLTGAAPLWGSYMEAVYSNADLVSRLAVNGQPPPVDFVRPAGISERPLCALSSATIGSLDCAPDGTELFLDSAVAPTPTPAPADDRPAVAWERLEPAVWRAVAIPLPPLPEVGDAAVAPEQAEDQPPAQLFCHFAEGTPVELLPPQAAPQIFLTPPRNPESLKPAHEWAQANNIALLPTSTCTEELLALGLGASETAVWRITSPKDGDTISGNVPIVGTASFDPAVVQFYKIELGIPNGTDVQWLTLGEVHNTPVVNGTLEVLQAEALPPGTYYLRLIVVKDSNYVGEPHQIQIHVEPPPSP